MLRKSFQPKRLVGPRAVKGRDGIGKGFFSLLRNHIRRKTSLRLTHSAELREAFPQFGSLFNFKKSTRETAFEGHMVRLS